MSNMFLFDELMNELGAEKREEGRSDVITSLPIPPAAEVVIGKKLFLDIMRAFFKLSTSIKILDFFSG